MKFSKGNPGRPKGALNKATVAIKEFARQVLEGPYRTGLIRRASKGRLTPQEVTLLHYYAWGRPRYQVDITTPPEPDPFVLLMDKMSKDDLKSLAAIVQRAQKA